MPGSGTPATGSGAAASSSGAAPAQLGTPAVAGGLPFEQAFPSLTLGAAGKDDESIRPAHMPTYATERVFKATRRAHTYPKGQMPNDLFQKGHVLS